MTRKLTLAASFEAESLHADIIRRAAHCLRGGVTAPPALLDRYQEKVEPEYGRSRRRVAELESSCARVNKEIDAALELATEKKAAGIADEAAAYDGLASKKALELRTLKAELAALQELIDRPVTPPEVLESAMDVVILALQVLSHTTQRRRRLPQEVIDALYTVLTDLRFDVTPGWVYWELDIRVPTELGPMVFGPIAGRVANTRFRNTTRQYRQDRAQEWLKVMFEEGLNLDELCKEAGFGEQVVRRDLLARLTQLIPSRYARAALVDSPAGELRQAVWSLCQHATPPAHLDPRYVETVGQTYLSPRYQCRKKRRVAVRLRTAVISALAESPDGWLPRSALLSINGMDKVHYYQMTAKVGTTTWLPATIEVDTRNGEPGAKLITCRHCGSLVTQLVLAAEVPDALLCSNCHRMPRIPSSPTYPAGYFPPDQDQRMIGA